MELKKEVCVVTEGIEFHGSDRCQPSDKCVNNCVRGRRDDNTESYESAGMTRKPSVTSAFRHPVTSPTQTQYIDCPCC